MASIEEKVEEQYKSLLDSLGIRHYGKTEKINPNTTNALRNAGLSSYLSADVVQYKDAMISKTKEVVA